MKFGKQVPEQYVYDSMSSAQKLKLFFLSNLRIHHHQRLQKSRVLQTLFILINCDA